MPIEIDASSPALATASDEASVASASFTPPAGSLLVAKVAAVSDDSPTVSGGSLTWTRRVQRTQFGTDYAEIWTALVASSGSMSIALGGLTGVVGRLGAIKVSVVTGQHPSDPIGASGNNTASTNTLNVTGYSSTGAGSWGFMSAIDSDGLGNPTAGGGDTGYPWTEVIGSTDISGIAIVKAAATANSGTSVTFNADAPGSGSAAWAWAALEILSQPDPPRRTMHRPTAAVHRAASW